MDVCFNKRAYIQRKGKNNKSQTHSGRQKMKSQCANEKEKWQRIQGEANE